MRSGQCSQSGCATKVADGCLLKVSLIAWPFAGEGAGYTLGYLKNKRLRLRRLLHRGTRQRHERFCGLCDCSYCIYIYSI